MSSKTFIKITNQDIYDKLLGIDRSLSKMRTRIFYNSGAIMVFIAVVGVLFRMCLE